LLELGKFASLLVSILCLYALFHTVFLTPVNGFEQRILISLRMLALAAGACWTSGYLFYCWDRKIGVRHASIATTFPVKLFWWALAIILGLFLMSWLLQVYFLPPRGLLRH
jgi:magnesium-transporting ATPase (P-type)